MVFLAYPHGPRASELIELRFDDFFDIHAGRVWVKRLKNGLSTRHPLASDEFRAVKPQLRGRDDRLAYAFLSGHGGPMTCRLGNIVAFGLRRQRSQAGK